ncbi:MAG: TonB-dependent receptor, partial [Deltaproteobacteria bacterium]|nr:TonB-dependent receptor [Deltaproteobacteria bacterium]
MKKKAHIFLSLCFLCLCLCLPLLTRAEGVDHAEIVTLEPIIITADRLPQPLAKSTSSVTLITEKEITENHVTLPDEILRGMPGLSVNSSGTMGETISVRLRGGNSYQTLVLIDGLKVNSPWNGAYGEWGNTELTDIGRIEIIKGTQSELYGSEAMGGVVHLLTKEGERAPGFTLAIDGGSFETRKESLQVAGGKESLHYLFSTARSDSKGQFDNDAYQNTGFTARVDWKTNQAFSLKSISRYRNAEKELAVNPDEL